MGYSVINVLQMTQYYQAQTDVGELFYTSLEDSALLWSAIEVDCEHDPF